MFFFLIFKSRTYFLFVVYKLIFYFYDQNHYKNTVWNAEWVNKPKKKKFLRPHKDK